MSKEIEKMTAIYEKHKNTMYAVALKILKNPQDAEDAVHNTIPPIMRNLDAIKDVDSKDCIYYVTMAVKHMSFNMIRDRHIQTVSLSDIEYEFASDESIRLYTICCQHPVGDKSFVNSRRIQIVFVNFRAIFVFQSVQRQIEILLLLG